MSQAQFERDRNGARRRFLTLPSGQNVPWEQTIYGKKARENARQAELARRLAENDRRRPPRQAPQP